MKLRPVLFFAALGVAALLSARGASAALLINELDSDSVNTPSTDAFEFVELYNTSGTSASLDGYVLVYWNGNGDVSYFAQDLDTYSIPANGYFTVGSIAGANITVASNLLQNGADAVGLYLGDATSFPNGTALTTANLIDAVAYDTGDADDAGLLTLLVGGGQVDEFGRDGSTTAGALDSIGRLPNGSGAARDTSTWRYMVPTPGAANSIPEPASVVMTALAGLGLLASRRRR